MSYKVAAFALLLLAVSGRAAAFHSPELPHLHHMETSKYLLAPEFAESVAMSAIHQVCIKAMVLAVAYFFLRRCHEYHANGPRRHFQERLRLRKRRGYGKPIPPITKHCVFTEMMRWKSLRRDAADERYLPENDRRQSAPQTSAKRQEMMARPQMQNVERTISFGPIVICIRRLVVSHNKSQRKRKRKKPQPCPICAKAWCKVCAAIEISADPATSHPVYVTKLLIC